MGMMRKEAEDKEKYYQTFRDLNEKIFASGEKYKPIYTYEPLKESDISLDSIRYTLSEISKDISRVNEYNLTDINIICEDIYGAILNRLYKYDLKSANIKMQRNCPAVDLIDNTNKITFQITSTSSKYVKRKITDTIKKFNAHNSLYRRYDSLNILFLNDLSDDLSKMKDKPLNNGSKFSYSSNIYDNKRLLKDIKLKHENGDKDIILDIYNLLMLVLNSSRLERSSILKEYYRSRNCYSSYNSMNYFFQHSLGMVTVSAYYENNEVCAKLEFLADTLSNVEFQLSNDVLRKEYFVDEDSFYRLHIKQHNVADNPKNGRVWYVVYHVSQGNPLVHIDSLSVQRIYLLFNELWRKSKEIQVPGSTTMQDS